MRISHVIDYFHTDVGYQEYFLALEQARAGHEVRVITSRNRHHTVAVVGPDEEAGAAALEAEGVEVVRLPARQLGHDRAWISDQEAALRAFRPDAIHCHGPFAPTTLRVARAGAATGTPVLVDNHMQRHIAPGALTPAGRAFYTTFRLTAGRYLRHTVSDWVAIGPQEADFLSERMGLPLEQIALIPLGFDPSTFAFDDGRRQVIRHERGWTEDVVVAVTGKLNPRKRVDIVAGACWLARGKGRPVRLVIAGDIDGSHLAAAMEAAGELVQEGRVVVAPMLSKGELADLYLAADVVVFPRLPSISIYEAAGTGARVLVGKDSFGDWLHGMHVEIEPVDSDDLADVLAPGTGRASAAARARSVFAWEVISADFVRRYEAMS